MYRGKAEALQQGTADKNKGSCQRVVTESKGGSGDKGLNATMHNNISRSISPDPALWYVHSKTTCKQLCSAHV